MTISAVNLTNVANPTVDRATSTPKTGFSDTLSSAIQQVDNLQASADEKVASLLSGTGQDVHDTTIAVQRASLAFELMLQVRNKVVNAYQEISRLQF